VAGIKSWAIAVFGILIMLFGLGCLNYTKIGGVEHHTNVASERGWPAPSLLIAHLGMVFAPLGAGILGWGLGRKTSSATQYRP
jgi:hypothetical protein